MKKNGLKYLLFAVLGVGVIAAIIIGVVKLGARTGSSEVVTTSFIEYDIARAVMGDDAKIKMLLSPGAEMHDFEPTPQDIVDIKNAKLFVYGGGESDEWVAELVRDNSVPDEKTLKLMELVTLYEEETTPEMEVSKHEHDETEHEHDTSKHEHDETEHEHDTSKHEHDEATEYDEHVWTSPVNTIQLVNGVKDRLIKIFPENAAKYTENADQYIAKLTEIDQKIREVVKNGANKPLIFGDRFPFLYFVREYGLSYAAAFPGCSEQTEASAATVAKLIEKAKTAGAKIILKIELTSNKIAQAIADEVGGTVREFSAAHNISKADFEKGVTYVDIWEQNIQVLEEALK